MMLPVNQFRILHIHHLAFTTTMKGLKCGMMHPTLNGTVQPILIQPGDAVTYGLINLVMDIIYKSR